MTEMQKSLALFSGSGFTEPEKARREDLRRLTGQKFRF